MASEAKRTSGILVQNKKGRSTQSGPAPLIHYDPQIPSSRDATHNREPGAIENPNNSLNMTSQNLPDAMPGGQAMTNGGKMRTTFGMTPTRKCGVLMALLNRTRNRISSNRRRANGELIERNVRTNLVEAVSQSEKSERYAPSVPKSEEHLNRISKTARRFFLILALAASSSMAIFGGELPAKYFELVSAGVATVAERLASNPSADLEKIESAPGWKHFPSAILAAAVLYKHPHPSNLRRGDPKFVSLAFQIGDLLASEHARGRYTSRLDHHRDTYMWLEAYRLLEKDLLDERRARWKVALMDLLQKLADDVAEKQNFPWYNSPFISTSPNHYSLWAAKVFLGGKVFNKPEWEKLGGRVLHRFASEEQAPDGFWGEHSRNGPTTGYDYLTETAVALYYEHSHDPAALEALRRSTEFHKYFTYPDGTPVETINDRNRYWSVSPWGHFGFSNFADGRRYAEFLTSFFKTNSLGLETLGLLAQDALYFHEGPTAPMPLDEASFHHQMSIPAGIRKNGPWITCLSGLIATPTTSRWYLDRQGHLSVYHEKLGLILTGANSKHQPELATITETIGGQVVHVPTSTRLKMNDDSDQLALAFNSFFAVVELPPSNPLRQQIRVNITPTGRIASAELNLQFALRAGENLESAAGKKTVLDENPIRWSTSDLGGWIRHRGWTLKLPIGARLTWPIFPFNPYRDGPETELAHAVGTISIPLTGKQEINFEIEAE